MTTTTEAKQFVMVGVLGAGGIAAIDQARRGNIPSAKIGIGVIASGAFLLTIAQFAPALAAALAALLLTTSVFVTGAGTWTAISRLTK